MPPGRQLPQKSCEMRIADRIFERLKTETSCIYLVPGGGAMFLVDALGRSGIKYIATIHEQGAGYAALSHGMLGETGVCLVTAGPGATNALTPCAAAWMDSIPMLFISGQPKSSALIGNTGLRTRGVQEIDVVSMARPITKLADQPTGKDCLDVLEKMIFLCKDGRPGPCWLSVPLDVQGAAC